MRTQTVTLVFSDVVGSTELLSSLGPERGHELRRDLLSALRSAVDGHGGREVKSLGDGLMAVFFSAGESVEAAMAMQRAIQTLHRRQPELNLALRVGVAAGDATEEDGDWFGTPVVEAARLCAAADGGQILISELVGALMGFPELPRFESLGPMTLKGLPRPVKVCSVAWTLGSGYRPPLPEPLDTSRRFVFVGRQADRAAVDEAWRLALDGHDQLRLVAGEPGVGKTRLVAELARRVHPEGAVVLYGRCDEEFGVPYQPFVEAVRPLVAGCPVEELAELVGPGGPDLARLLPEVATRLGLTPPAEGDETETGRQRMFQAFNNLLSRLAVTAPVLLILDDLQWAAKPTLLLLRFLVRTDEPRRLLVLGTYRDTDLDRAHPLAGMLADLRREQRVERLDLGGLSDAEVTEFVAAAAGHSLDPSMAQVAQAIYVETEGNPFFVSELLRHLTESGTLVQTDGHWSPSRPLTDLGIPEGVRALIGRRLSRLSTATNDVLGAASVIRRHFDTSLLVAVSGAGEDQVLDALEAAERSRLIILEPGRVDRYFFKHALVRSTLYDELPTARRLRLHRRVGLELEARGAAEDETGLVELAYHFLEAAALGEVDRAVRYGRMAGHRARARLAFEEAAAHYEGALGALQLVDEPDRVLEAELKLGLAACLREAGEEQFRAVAFEVADEARLVGDGPLLARAALVLTAVGGGPPIPVTARKVQLIEEALEMLDRSGGDPGLRALLLGVLAVELLWDPEQEQRRRWLAGEALGMARGLTDEMAALRVMATAHQGISGPDNLPERMALADELVSRAMALGDVQLTFYARLIRYGDLIEIPNLKAADDDLRCAQELAGELGLPQLTWWATAVGAGRALLAGDLDRAGELQLAAAEAASRASIEAAVATSTAISLRWVLHWEAGELDEALAQVRMAAGAMPLVAYWRAVESMLLAELGRQEEARVVFATAVVAPLPRDPVWLAGTFALACAAADLALGSEIRRLRRELSSFSGRVAWNGAAAVGPVDLALARLDAAAGDDTALATFAAAAACAELLEAPTWARRISQLAQGRPRSPLP